MAATIQQLESYLGEISNLAQSLGSNFDAPLLVSIDGKPEFRHNTKTGLLMTYLKCLRAVSSLNAALVLLKNGYVQEVGALCRCVDEFCEDILFLATPLGEGNEYSNAQRQLVDEYFQEEFEERSSSVMQSSSRHRVPRDKVQAGIARINGHPINPNDAKQMHRTLGKTFSGYIHGAYPHTMEMYGGPSIGNLKFHLNGMPGTPRMAEWTDALFNYIYRTAMSIEVVATRCQDGALLNKLKKARNEFEESTNVDILSQKELNRLLKKK